jgi:putative membrane protein
MMGLGLGGIFLWLLLIGLIVLAVVLILRATRGQGGGGVSDSALEIARRRYARGEISKEEYEQLRRDLR